MKKFFKKIFVFLVIGFVIMAGILSNFVKVNADVGTIEYNEYNYLINVFELNYQDDFYLYNVIAVIDNNQLDYVGGDNVGYSWKSDWQITAEGVYLVSATAGESQLGNAYYYLIITLCTPYESYLATYDNYSYTYGYSEGLSKGREYGYNEAVEEYNDYYGEGGEGYEYIYGLGETAGSSDYAYGTEGYWTIYNAGKDYGYSAGIDYATRHDLTEGSAFYNMLRQIAMYPVEIFTTGLDVDIFGINVGGFLLGIGMVALIFTIIKLFRG